MNKQRRQRIENIRLKLEATKTELNDISDEEMRERLEKLETMTYSDRENGMKIIVQIAFALDAIKEIDGYLKDVLTASDIPAQMENDEVAHARAGESVPDEVKEDAKLFFEMVQKSKEEIAQMFNSGMFNSIAVGYGKIALEAMGLTGKSLVAFEKEMKYAFDMYNAEEALKVYNRTEGGKQ